MLLIRQSSLYNVVTAGQVTSPCLSPCIWVPSPNHPYIPVLPSGDPTRFGTLPPHPIVRESVRKALESGKYEGYAHSTGLRETRKAIADAFTCDSARLTEDVS